MATLSPSLAPAAGSRPILAALAGIALFSTMDALMKGAAIAQGVYVALLWRNLIGAGLGLPLWWAEARMRGAAPALPSRRAMTIHVARAAVVAPMALLFFDGLRVTPMAVGMALSFVAPLAALYMAALFLGEPVTLRAQGASLLGLAGVGVIAAARGLGGGSGGGSLFGVAEIVASALLYAANLVLQRRQAQMSGPVEVAFFQNLMILAMLAPLAPWLGAWPAGPRAALALAGAAVLAFGALWLLSWAYARAETHRLLPIEYSAFAWSALTGWLWFDEAVEASTIAGVVLIVAGCWIGTAGKAEPGEQSAL